MRTAGVLGFLAPSLLFVGASLAACDDSSNGSSSGDFQSEGGTFEAGPEGDGAAPDTSMSADGAKTDGAMGTGVSVTVGDSASPKANVRVIFQDGSGAILGEAMTDAAGMAVSTALPSMVTVLYAPPAQAGEAVTFLGVSDGDALHVVPSPQLAATALGDISVTFTGDALTRAAGFIYAYAGNDQCRNSAAGTGQALLIHMTSLCARPQNTIFAEADDASSTQGFAFAKMIASPSGGSTVSAGKLTFTPAGTRTLAATSLPSADSPSGTARAVVGTDLHILTSPDATAITDAAPGLTLSVPRDTVDAFQTEVSTSYDLAGGFSTTSIVQKEAATIAATGSFKSVDFSTALPHVTAVDATAEARPAVTISTSSAPAAAAGYVRISWGTASTWSFVMPGNTKAFKVPALPADATTFTPNGPVNVDAVGYADGPLLPSYAALKALPIPTETAPALLDDQQALPALGLIKLSTYERALP